MFKVFSTREVAIGIWLVLIFLYVLWKKELRKSFKKVCKNAFTPKLVIPAMLILFIGSLVTTFAARCSFWDDIYYKDVIMWIILVGFPLCYGGITNKEHHYFHNAIVSNLKITVLYEYVFSTFTYSLFVELLIIPVIVIISSMKFLAEHEERGNRVVKLLNDLLIIIGMAMLFFTVKHALEEFEMGMVNGMLASLIIPLVLSILYVPFAYLFALYATYENAFLTMRFCEPRNRKIRILHRIKALIICNVSLRKTRLLSENAAKYIRVKLSEKEYNEFMRKIWRKDSLL